MDAVVHDILGIFIRGIGTAHTERRKSLGNGHVGVGAAASVDHRLYVQMA